MGDARPNWLPCLILRLIIQTIRQDRSGSNQIDDLSNVSRLDPSGADQIDAEHQATDLAVGGSNPSRRAEHPAHRLPSKGSSARRMCPWQSFGAQALNHLHETFVFQHG
jgi:hypothetical protein